MVAEVRLYREGLAEIIGREPDIEVVGTAGDDDSALNGIAALRPMVVLLDVDAAAHFSLVSEIARVAPDAAVVALGRTDADEEVLMWADVGVAGFVTREQSIDNVVSVVRRVRLGDLIVSQWGSRMLPRRLVVSAAEPSRALPGDRLTHRELEIARLIEEGRSNKEIARALYIAMPTVKTHVHRILEKLGARRRGEAAARLRSPDSSRYGSGSPWDRPGYVAVERRVGS